MKAKSFAVIGLGQFGMTLARELANADYDVLAIDDKDENIQEIAETVTYAVRADVREPDILKSLGVQNVDVAIVAVAENLTSNGFEDIFELSSEFSMAEFRIPADWAGKSLAELKIREKYKINVVAVKLGDEVNVNIDPAEKLKEGCVLVAAGKNQDLNRMKRTI